MCHCHRHLLLFGFENVRVCRLNVHNNLSSIHILVSFIITSSSIQDDPSYISSDSDIKAAHLQVCAEIGILQLYESEDDKVWS